LRRLVILRAAAVILSVAKDLALIVLAALLLTPAVADSQSAGGIRCPVNRDPVARWGLPSGLAEVSGLAIGPGGRILGHGDEFGRLFELDPGSGKVLRRITLKGQPKGDFEGVAAAGKSIALMTSTGRLYVFKLSDAGDQVTFRTVETGLGKACELEGLAWDVGADALLIPCKNGKTRATRNGLTIFRWSMAGKGSAGEAIRVSAQNLSRAAGTPRINATSVDLDPVTGHLLLLSSRPALVLELESNGRIVGVARLRDEVHSRAEGLAVTKDAMYIGDESSGGRGTIAKYACEAGR